MIAKTTAEPFLGGGGWGGGGGRIILHDLNFKDRKKNKKTARDRNNQDNSLPFCANS